MNARHVQILVGAALLVLMGQLAGAAAELPDTFCMDCHAKDDLTKTNQAGQTISLFTDAAKLHASTHGTNTCSSCHIDLTDKHPDDDVAAKLVDCSRCHEKQAATYSESAHAIAIRAGKPGVAACADCHGSHEILKPTLPNSPLHISKQAQTCGECHTAEVADYNESLHGKALAAGVRDAPTCTDCHSEHSIKSLKTVESARHISEDVCSRCHASQRINTKYNLPGDRVRTFFDSYHGLASQYGSTVAAHCGSCHGNHKILPSTDEASSINKAHLVETCGKCHPGANENFAFSAVHVDIASAKTAGGDIGVKINWWARKLYVVMIVGVIGGMLIHNLLLFRRKILAHFRSTGRSVVRMNGQQRVQHAALAISFIVLAISGFALKFPNSGIAHLMGSSETLRRCVHRISGVALLLVGVWHIVYILRTREGWQLVKDLLPTKKDLFDVMESARYLVGLSETKPKIGRFGYAEKMEYWAVVWGTFLMGVTGLLIWFKIDVTKFLPRWAVDVSFTIHYYEAILACLAIVVWHFYHVIFDPDVYPLNMACLDGNVSEHWHKEEHELDTKARNVVPSAEIPLHKKRAGHAGGKAVEPVASGNGNGNGHSGNGHGRS